MNISNVIRERRSIRRYKKAPVEQELIVSLLSKAVSWYESEGTPHWRCVHYGTLDARQKLAESMLTKVKESNLGKIIPSKMTEFFRKQMANSPAILIFIAEAGENQRQSDENYAAVCSIMQNFQLLGWEQGLGMLWFTDPLVYSETFFKTIGLQKGERLAGILNIGYFEKIPRARKRTPAEKKWATITCGNNIHLDDSHFSSQLCLDILNEAVWAPNDGLREPWRFIHVTGDQAAEKLQTSYHDTSRTYLLVVATEEADLHKQEEDYAAVCCVVQNFRLLAKSKKLNVCCKIPEWINDQKQCKMFGIHPQERVVAMLELGGEDLYFNTASHSPKLNITHL